MALLNLSFIPERRIRRFPSRTKAVLAARVVQDYNADNGKFSQSGKGRVRALRDWLQLQLGNVADFVAAHLFMALGDPVNIGHLPQPRQRLEAEPRHEITRPDTCTAWVISRDTWCAVAMKRPFIIKQKSSTTFGDMQVTVLEGCQQGAIEEEILLSFRAAPVQESTHQALTASRFGGFCQWQDLSITRDRYHALAANLHFTTISNPSTSTTMSLIEIESEDQFTQLTKDDPTKLIALYFHTPWAAPCQTMNSVVKTLAQANPSVRFLSINADDHSDISELFEVSAVPYIILIRNSTILQELSGADPKEFIAALKQFSGEAPTTNNEEASKPAQAAEPAETKEPTQEELNERLKKLTSAAPVMLFMKGSPSSPQCGFSRQLVAILREHQVRFGFFDILKDDTVRQGLKTFSDWPTFPQLYINGEFQGGLDIIKESLEEDPDFFQTAQAV